MIKKRLSFILLLLVCVFEVFSVDVASVPVEFTSDKGWNVGISRNMVSSTIKPEESFVNNTVNFTPSSDFKNYSTGTFYIYLQSFTAAPLTVSIKTSDLSNDKGDTISYTNSGSNTKDFKKSGYEGNIFKTGTISKPTTYNIALNLSIPVGALDNSNQVPSGEYSGTITVTVSSNGG